MTWTSTRLKFLSSMPITNGVGEAGGQSDPEWPRYVRTTDIAGPKKLRENTFASLPPDVACRASLERNDIVMTAAGATIGKSLMYLSDEPACYAGYLVRFRARADVEPRFVSYWTESEAYWAQIRAGKVVSTIENFSGGKYRNLRIAIPSHVEQRAIADFLDHETARIDALISKKSDLILRLQERQDALIRDAVLGLLGKHPSRSAPAGWTTHIARDREPTPLKAVLELRSESNWPIRTEQVLSLTADRGVIPYEEKGDIGNKKSEDISRYSLVYENDIVMNSMNVIIGSVGLSRFHGALSPVYYVLMLRPGAQADIRFLAYHFRIREFQKQLARLGYGILEHRLRIPWINLGREVLFLPPLQVQRQVVDDLDLELQRLDRLIRRYERSIGLLREHRQALITAAVTGQMSIYSAA